MKKLNNIIKALLIGSLLILVACKQTKKYNGYRPDSVSINVSHSDGNTITIGNRDSITFDMYRGVNLINGMAEPIYIDTTINVYHMPVMLTDSTAIADTVYVNNINHWVVTPGNDDISNAHKAVIVRFVKRVTMLDEGRNDE